MKHISRRITQKAFTIVELLVIISVIGILASITVVSYNGVQDRARKAAAIDSVNQAVNLLEAFQLKHNGLYPASNALASAGVRDGKDVYYRYTQSPGGRNYCITATSRNISYMATQDVRPMEGVCPGH